MTVPDDPESSFLCAALTLGVIAGSCLGCSTLERFDTSGKAAFCGELVASPSFQEGFLPRGVEPPTLKLKLDLDVDALRSRPEQPIVVGRLDSDDTTTGLCSGSGASLLDAAALRTIPELDHDPLSLLEFGEGRDYSFFGWVDSACQGTFLALTSLMRNDDVEVRLLKPAAMPPENPTPEQSPGFALFRLRRQSQGCDF